MGVGIGGLITNLMQGDPSSQIASALAGPNPNPQAAAGGPPSPTGAPGPGGPPQGQQQQQMPPAQAYAPDPANASTIAMLLRVHQQDMASNDLNTNINRMAAGFGTAQQQHDKMAALGAGGGGGDTLGALGEIMKLQGSEMDLQNKQRFQASAELLGQSFGLKAGQGAMLSADPELYNVILSRKVADQSPTELQKNITAYETQARAAKIPEDQIQAAVQMAFTGSLSPGSRDEKDMNAEMQRWANRPENKGKDPRDQPQFKDLAAFKGYNEDIGKQAQAAGQEKITAATGLPSTLQTIKPVEDNLAQMFGPDGKVKPEVIRAIQSPDPPTDGVLGALAGYASRHGAIDPSVLDQKNRIVQLQNQLSANAMQNIKNIRTQREFNAIGSASSPIFAKTNSEAQIQAGLEELRNKFGLAKANAIAAGGGEIPAEYADKVSKDYLSGGALDNGATIAKPAAGAEAGPTTGRAATAAEEKEFQALVKAGGDPERLKANALRAGVILR